jgi:flagellar biosynthesis chaperone FliJ
LKKKRKQCDEARTRLTTRRFNVLRKTEKWKGRNQNLEVWQHLGEKGIGKRENREVKQNSGEI